MGCWRDAWCAWTQTREHVHKALVAEWQTLGQAGRAQYNAKAEVCMCDVLYRYPLSVAQLISNYFGPFFHDFFPFSRRSSAPQPALHIPSLQTGGKEVIPRATQARHTTRVCSGSGINA